MRILTFTETAFALGAHARHKEMAKALLSAGHEVVWLGPSRADVSSLDGVQFVQLKALWLLRLSLLGYFLCFSLNLIDLAIRVGRFDAAFVIRERELLVMWLLRIGGNAPSLFFFQRAAAIEKLEVDLENEDHRSRRMKIRLQILFWRTMRTNLYRIPGKIVVQTPGHADDIADSCEGVEKKLIVLPNSIGASWMRNEGRNVRTLVDVPRQAKVLGYVGRMYMHGKGLDLMLRAVSLIAEECELVLVVFGGGPDFDRLKGLADELGLAGKVHWLGRVDGAVGYMASLDLLLHPSRIDDCPNVVLEALVCEVPLVATRIQAHEFLLGRCFPGLAEVDPASIADVAIAVLKDGELRRRLLARQNERGRVFDFDWGAEIVRIIEGKCDLKVDARSSPENGRAAWRARPLASLRGAGNRDCEADLY